MEQRDPETYKFCKKIKYQIMDVSKPSCPAPPTLIQIAGIITKTLKHSIKLMNKSIEEMNELQEVLDYLNMMKRSAFLKTVYTEKDYADLQKQIDNIEVVIAESGEIK